MTLPPDMAAIEAHLAWCRHRNLRPSTLAARRYHLKRIRRALAPRTLLDVDAETIRSWQAALTMGPSARRNLVKDARAFYTWAADEGLVDPAILRHLVAPRVPQGLPRPIPEPDLAAALRGAPDRIRPWLLLAAYAGLRACEVAPLRAEDLDLSGPMPTVRVIGKGGKDGVVPLPAVLVAELRRCHLPKRGWLFPKMQGGHNPRPVGGHVSASQVSHLASRYLHEIGSRSSFHALRHYAGTRLYQTSLDLRLTQDFMRHANIRTTAGYAAVRPGGLAAVVNQAFRPVSAT